MKKMPLPRGVRIVRGTLGILLLAVLALVRLVPEPGVTVLLVAAGVLMTAIGILVIRLKGPHAGGF